MTSSTTATGNVHLIDRHPQVTGAEMLASLVPPPQFSDASFDSYRADDTYPSQDEAKQRLMQFTGVGAAQAKRGGLFRRAPKPPVFKPGVYLDGGFGVGKTHLLAAVFHAMPARRKYFGSFIEYTALVGALGYKNTVDLLRGAALLCIDEFELDDPGDTMVMTRLLGELVSSGTKLAATSNTPPNALGEGRFAAQDFLREIHQMSDSFETLRIDGIDFRQRSIDGRSRVWTPDALAHEVAELSATHTVSDDTFVDLVRHLARVHPSRYLRLIDGVEVIVLRDVQVLTDQSEALRFVAFVDRAYDAQIAIRASGVPLDQVFSEDMLAGGYRKKYLRAISRLNSLTHAEVGEVTNRNWGALIGQVLRTVLGVLGGRQRSPVSPPRNEPQRARATLRSAPRPGASTGNASGSSSTAAPTHPDRRGTGHPESPGQAPSPGQFGPAATIERDPHRVKSLRVSYDPQRDGAPDAGEVIWTWVPYAENDGRGKDRPVLVIGRESRERVYAVKLTSKPRDGERDFLSIGAGPWDSQGRESWVDVDQLYSVHVDGMRREAAVLDRDRFDRVAALLVRRFGWQT